MIKVGIVGASGYTGVELARILISHPQVELTLATSRQYDGKPLSQVCPPLSILMIGLRVADHSKNIDILLHCGNYSFNFPSGNLH